MSRQLRRRLLGWVMLLLAGVPFYFAVSGLKEGLLAVMGAVLINIALDMIVLDVEKAKNGDD